MAVNSTSSVKARLRAQPSLKGPFPDTVMDKLPISPQEAFTIWLEDAITAGIKEPHAMTLSTIDERGYPDARILILKNLDERGWHFAINASSPKGRQIDLNPQVALTFYWSQHGRQVRVRGKAVQLPSDECAVDFQERPVASRVIALTSKQSQVLASPEDLKSSLAEAEALLENNPTYIAPGWRVFAVSPEVVEFWQGASDRLHQRLQYELLNEAPGAGWAKRFLWP